MKYLSLTKSSSPQDIADAYMEWAGTDDTQAKRDEAYKYLTNLGVHGDTINQAYGYYKGMTANPVGQAKATAAKDAALFAQPAPQPEPQPTLQPSPQQSGLLATVQNTVAQQPSVSTQEIAKAIAEIIGSAQAPAIERVAPPPAVTPAQYQIPQSQTTAGLLNSLMSSNSPYVEQARRYAMDEMAGRGLLNSSLAIGAAHDAALARAGDIAARDAEMYLRAGLANMQAQNEVNLANADRAYRAAEFNAGSLNRLAELGYASRLRMGEMQVGSILDRETKKFEASLDLNKMALAHGYDLEKLDRAVLADLRKMAVQQGYDLDKMSADQWNVLQRMAKAQGYDLEKMAKAQSFDMEKLAAAYGYDITKMKEGAELDLKKLAVQFDYDMAKVAKAAELQMAADEAQRAFQAVEGEKNRVFQKELQTLQNEFAKAGKKSELALSMGASYMQMITNILSDPNTTPETKASQLEGAWLSMNSYLRMVEKVSDTSFGEFAKFWTLPEKVTQPEYPSPENYPSSSPGNLPNPPLVSPFERGGES